jgi:hypothetical protein
VAARVLNICRRVKPDSDELVDISALSCVIDFRRAEWLEVRLSALYESTTLGSLLKLGPCYKITDASHAGRPAFRRTDRGDLSDLADVDIEEFE